MPEHDRSPGPWLISRRADLAVILGPPLAAVALAFGRPTAALPEGGYVLLVLCVDVAHVYGSLYRTYLDPDARARMRARLILTPALAFAGCAALYLLAPERFWTALAYLAIYHFIRQQVGMAMLYRLREGLPTRDLGARLERAAHWAVTGWPVLWWHAHLPRAFEWFTPGDFLIGLPAWALWPTGALALAALAGHGIARLRERRWSPGRDLWLLTTAAVWVGGIVLTNGDLAFTATNVVLHGVPYLALVGWTARRQWALTGRGPAVPAWFGAAGAYVLPLLVLAFAEEALWDRSVWHERAWLFGTAEIPLGILAVPLLSVPQVTHYLLDAHIWRLGPENPGLRRWLC